MTIPTPSARPKILVADDTTAEREHARRALELAGYRVSVVEDGQRAIEAFARERPDLVMLDVVMPRLSGLDACRILKAQTRGDYVPIILVSSRNSAAARVEGLRCGADDYLGKPYDEEELRARIEALLRIRHAATAASSPVGRGDAAFASGGEAGGATTDERFMRRFEEEFDRARRYSDPLACLRIELAEGTSAEAARALRDAVEISVRKIDLVHRYGAHAYLVILPNTHFPGALSVAERIVQRARRLPGVGEPVDLSVGIAFFPSRDVHAFSDLLDLTDRALARAREEGAGYICLYQHEGYLYRPEEPADEVEPGR
ncbi:MAG: response regulator [Deltaproteobacteria bacterium]|nr:MAG: response regulator [Deltaproteobacteria bacterium]